MLAHLFQSGVRALAASILAGGLIIYATGGLTSPYVTQLVGVSIAAFFIFWFTFALVFAKRPSVNDTKVDDGSTDGSSHFRQRGHRREHDDYNHDGDGDGEGGGGDGN